MSIDFKIMGVYMQKMEIRYKSNDKIGINIEDTIFFKAHDVLLIRFHSCNNFSHSNVVAINNNNIMWRSNIEDGISEGMVRINESRFRLIYKDKYIIYYIVDGKIKEIFRRNIYQRKKRKSYEERKQSVLNKFFHEN